MFINIIFYVRLKKKTFSKSEIKNAKKQDSPKRTPKVILKEFDRRLLFMRNTA